MFKFLFALFMAVFVMGCTSGQKPTVSELPDCNTEISKIFSKEEKIRSYMGTQRAPDGAGEFFYFVKQNGKDNWEVMMYIVARTHSIGYEIGNENNHAFDLITKCVNTEGVELVIFGLIKPQTKESV